MGAITAEVVSDEAKRDARGRKIIAEGRWRELVALYEGSGLTQTKFARREGINYSTFVAWLGRCRRTRLMPGNASRHFVEAQLPRRSVMAGRLEVQLPNGVVVRGEEIVTLVALVKALGT
jgi:DNA-binding transcriptional regulator YiaG